MSNALYILSNPRIAGEYKVGIHQGGLRKLQSRYETYITDVKIHYLIENVQAREVETKFKELYSSSRIPFQRRREKQGLSEWFKMPLDQIISNLLIMLVGKNYGINGKKSFQITELSDRVVDGTKIISPKQVVIDLTDLSDEEVDPETEEEA